MKKLILILMVGRLFGDTIVYKIGDNNRSIKNVELTKAGNGKVFFKAFGQETSRDCNKVIEFTDNDGNPIEYDCSVVLDEPKKDNPILSTINKSESHNHLIESGVRLIEFPEKYKFQKKYDRGFFIFRFFFL